MLMAHLDCLVVDVEAEADSLMELDLRLMRGVHINVFLPCTTPKLARSRLCSAGQS